MKIDGKEFAGDHGLPIRFPVDVYDDGSNWVIMGLDLMPVHRSCGCPL
ncbi:hypothetical protein LQF76_09335 [Gloeomargaritales cyanobacterium VI4D9]|nr:hypothetical protein LQF76_09335 [Gloeomargaritales cyanobacterium VI4D9]